METDILGYDGKYTIDKLGTVYSYAQTKKKKLKQQKASQSRKGYFQVRLYSGNEKRNKRGQKLGTLMYVHRLVWETHVGPIPDDMEIDHINGDTSNNSLENLQVITRRENIRKYNTRKSKNGIYLREHRDELIEDYKKLGTYEKVGEKWGVTWGPVYRTIKNIYHKKNFKTGKYYNLIFDDTIDDEFMHQDFRNSGVKKNVLLD